MASYDPLLLSLGKAPCIPMQKVPSPLALLRGEGWPLSWLPTAKAVCPGQAYIELRLRTGNTAFCFLSCSLPLLATYLPNGLQIFESYIKRFDFTVSCLGAQQATELLGTGFPLLFWTVRQPCPTGMVESEPDYNNRSKSDFKPLLILPEYIPDLPQRYPLCSPGTRSNQYSEIGSERLGYLMEHLHSPVKNPDTVR